MAFRPQDLCRTTRRVKGSSRRRLFPRLLRDDRQTPRLGLAIRFLETKLGLRRCELNGEALLHLFDDPKLARCLVGCLARSYRYRSRRLAEVVGQERAAALAARGVATPFDLRSLAFARANAVGGFISPGTRAQFLAELLPDLDVAEADQALWLDAPDQAVLVRVGPTPTANEIRALYNLRVLETLLRMASTVQLSLRGDRATVAAVCERHEVRVAIDGATVTLFGQQDSLGLWTRHGGRLARAVLTLLADGSLGPGEATVHLGDEAYEVRLDAALLADALPAHGWSSPAATWEAGEAFSAALLAERRTGRLAGWRLKRWPAPLVNEHSAVWPELSLTRGVHSIALLPLPAAAIQAAAAALRALADRQPLIVLALGEVAQAPSGLTVLPLTGAAGAPALIDHLERTYPRDQADEALPVWLSDLVAAARAAGSLAESELARRLDCTEEQVGSRLAGLIERGADVVYIDGFGLCAEPFLERARTLLDEAAQRNGGRLDLRAVGRQLRVLAGRNEGLHALIAHLSGELRPVA